MWHWPHGAHQWSLFCRHLIQHTTVGISDLSFLGDSKQRCTWGLCPVQHHPLLSFLPASTEGILISTHQRVLCIHTLWSRCTNDASTGDVIIAGVNEPRHRLQGLAIVRCGWTLYQLHSSGKLVPVNSWNCTINSGFRAAIVSTAGEQRNNQCVMPKVRYGWLELYQHLVFLWSWLVRADTWQC